MEKTENLTVKDIAEMCAMWENCTVRSKEENLQSIIDICNKTIKDETLRTLLIESLELKKDLSGILTHLEEGLRCEVFCNNPMKSDTGCDGGCNIDNKLNLVTNQIQKNFQPYI